MAALNRTVNAAMTAIHKEQVPRVGRDLSSDDGDFTDPSDTDGVPFNPTVVFVISLKTSCTVQNSLLNVY